jgi:hypothetical protein
MDDALAVRRVERVSNLSCNVKRFCESDWARSQPLGQCRSVDEFQY